METNFEAVVGKPFTFKTKPALGFSGVVQGEVLLVELPHRLVYSWQGRALPETPVSGQLEVKQVTKLTLKHTGFAGLRDLSRRIILGTGWGKLLRNIRSWLELPKEGLHK